MFSAAVASATVSCVLTADFDALVAGGGTPGAQDTGAPSSSDGGGARDGGGGNDGSASDGGGGGSDATVDGGGDAGVTCAAPKTAGPAFGTAATSGATLAWLSPSLALDADGNATTVTLGPDEKSASLVVTGFDLGVPAGATITGVRVTVRKRSTSDKVRDDDIKLYSGGSPRGDERKGSGKWPTSFGDVSVGSASDLWSTTLTPSMVNDSGFGVTFRAKYDDSSGSGAAEVDAVSITVTYCD